MILKMCELYCTFAKLVRFNLTFGLENNLGLTYLHPRVPHICDMKINDPIHYL